MALNVSKGDLTSRRRPVFASACLLQFSAAVGSAHCTCRRRRHTSDWPQGGPSRSGRMRVNRNATDAKDADGDPSLLSSYNVPERGMGGRKHYLESIQDPLGALTENASAFFTNSSVSRALVRIPFVDAYRMIRSPRTCRSFWLGIPSPRTVLV